MRFVLIAGPVERETDRQLETASEAGSLNGADDRFGSNFDRIQQRIHQAPAPEAGPQGEHGKGGVWQISGGRGDDSR